MILFGSGSNSQGTGDWGIVAYFHARTSWDIGFLDLLVSMAPKRSCDPGRLWWWNGDWLRFSPTIVTRKSISQMWMWHAMNGKCMRVWYQKEKTACWSFHQRLLRFSQDILVLSAVEYSGLSICWFSYSENSCVFLQLLPCVSIWSVMMESWQYPDPTIRKYPSIDREFRNAYEPLQVIIWSPKSGKPLHKLQANNMRGFHTAPLTCIAVRTNTKFWEVLSRQIFSKATRFTTVNH